MSDFHALSLQPGDIVGGYTLVSRLGAGAMGSVWRAVDGGGTAYAMKILRDSLDDDELDPVTRKARTTARERLRREAMALKRIDDPGVCAIVDMEIDDAVAFIVTELIEGKNLREDVRQNGRYVGDDLERLAAKLIDAVRAVHAAGIVHRDIKPTNVMVSVTGPVLVDFGIAMGEGESHVTSTGLVMGTPGFIAPEIIEGAEADEVTDWWSTASVLAFAATGEPVFGTQPMMAVLQREASGSANLQGLPARTMQAFRAALDPDPRRRATPQQLLDAITQDAWDAQAAMPPFDGSRTAAADGVPSTLRKYDEVDNPRRLWRAQGMPTAMISFDPARLGPGTPPPAPPTPTVAMPARATGGGRAPADAVQASQPTLSMAQGNGAPTQAFVPDVPREPRSAASSRPVDDEAPMDDPVPTATVAMAGGAAQPPSAMATVAVPAAGLPATRQDAREAFPPAGRGMPGEGMAPGTDGTPREGMPGPAAFAPDLRARLARRGWLVTGLLSLPLSCLAACYPAVACVVAAVLLWVFCALGINADAHAGRIAHRQGAAHRSDTALRAVAFPWHLVRAIVPAVPRILAMWAIALAVTCILAWALPLPVADTVYEFLGTSMVVPMPTGRPWSPTGASLAAAAAAGWLAVAAGPRSHGVRLGAGTCIGLPASATGRPNRLQLCWLAVFVACLVALCIGMEILTTIDWWPLPASWSLAGWWHRLLEASAHAVGARA